MRLSKADLFLSKLEARREIDYDDAVRELKTRNLQGLITQLRGRGHKIEPVMAVGSQGSRYAKAYKYEGRSFALGEVGA